MASAALDELLAGAFDESKHPRDPGGEGGGRWISKGEEATSDPVHDLHEALHSWVGDPAAMRIHMANELAGEPEPDNESGRSYRRQARALLREVRENGRPNDIRLYRRAPDLAGRLPLPQSWSELKSQANRFDGELFSLGPGEGRGIRVRDYISSGLDVRERQWLMDPLSFDRRDEA
jgi:hypothetical protein